jgi:hypothetical protein
MRSKEEKKMQRKKFGEVEIKSLTRLCTILFWVHVGMKKRNIE